MFISVQVYSFRFVSQNTVNYQIQNSFEIQSQSPGLIHRNCQNKVYPIQEYSGKGTLAKHFRYIEVLFGQYKTRTADYGKRTGYWGLFTWRWGTPGR